MPQRETDHENDFFKLIFAIVVTAILLGIMATFYFNNKPDGFDPIINHSEIKR